MDYSKKASEGVIIETINSLQENGFITQRVETKEEALDLIKSLIPQNASVMNGASKTLEEIGYIDYLKSENHKWKNLHKDIIEEKDELKKAELRKASVLSDFYLGSVHAVTKQGEIMIASNTGSQLPHIAFTSPNIIFIVGTQKIVDDMVGAMDRLDKRVIPLEDERMKSVYGFGTTHAKTLILHKENQAMGRKVHIIFVNEVLGF